MKIPTRVKAVGAALALGAGTVYGIGEALGPGDCVGINTVINPDLARTLHDCTGVNVQQSAEGIIRGPEKLSEFVIHKQLTLTFGEIGLSMHFPRDSKSGDYSDLDWDPGGLNSCLGTCETIYVTDEPLQVNVVPCTTVAEDYSSVLIAPSDPSTATKPKSKFDLYINKSEETINVEGNAIAACWSYLPDVTIDGKRNILPMQGGNGAVGDIFGVAGVPAEVQQTFAKAHEDLAVTAAAAQVCLESMVDFAPARQQIEAWAKGSAVELDPAYADYDVVIKLKDSKEVRPIAENRYKETRKFYEKLQHPLTGNTKLKMKITFTDKGADLAGTNCTGNQINR